MGRMISQLVLPFHLLLMLGVSLASLNDHRYNIGDEVPLFVNKVGPLSNPSETYQYYDLPFCQPGELLPEKESLGEVLNGDRLTNTLYQLKFGVEKDGVVLCHKKLDQNDVSKFRTAIIKDYYYQMYFDDLPFWGFVGKIEDELWTLDGKGPKYFLFKHVQFDVLYNGNQVIEIHALGDPSNVVDITEDIDLTVTFTYTVRWNETSIPFENRIARYSRASGKPVNRQIHWFSIINSIVISVLLMTFFAVSMMQRLKNDLRKWSSGDEEEDKEVGWKYLHGDVFRCPPNMPLLCAVIGAGTQKMLSSLSHTSSSTTAFFLSSSAKFLRPRFSSCPFQFPIHQKRHRSLFSHSTAASMDSAATVDSVADDLKKQNLKGVEIKLKLNLEELNWDNSFVRELPGDPRSDSIPREVLHACYTKVLPSVPVNNPQLVAWSESVAELLELDPREFERPDFPLIFSGASPLVGAIPYAQNYGGHQFGMWAGQLGDGRAITLGEILNSKSQRWELQLKGAGKTPYSRFADGLAVLRSSIREFLCSEAMHGLGIPTTRALCLVTTGKDVMRDMFYDGNPKDEPGAIVCRVAQSFLRFGSYQLHASRGKKDFELVRALADYAIRYHFPHLENMTRSESISANTDVDLTSNKYAAWAVEVAERTASMIARWQDVGFTHGVMNTDNMSVLGLTIDYGPFGFLDSFDPSYTPNTTDLPGRRYCFANQPDVGLWNIAQFTSALSTAELLSDKEADYAMERYGNKFMDDYQDIMTRKLGLTKYNKKLIGELLKNMVSDKVDYTNFFRSLSNIKADPAIPEDQLLIPLKDVLLDIGMERREAWTNWIKSYIQELSTTGVLDEERKVSMNFVNPKYILRNYLCQNAIDAAEQGDFEEVRQLLKVMQCPFDEQPGMEKYARLPPAWAHRPGVCMLSCSS